ncbi:DUF86 domain-containing protein [Thioalkalicoccus limnaeus]|uniref:DUF86 domain-containing protein n=1 Tax=Thioalkalicoccus limnaeus TaxID=120681 RepID=A0ABV4BGJ0_9GAMM
MTPVKDSDAVLLRHGADCIERISEYTKGERATFMGSRLVQDAVIRNLQTLAESTQRLSDRLKSAEPGIPWRDIAGFRNVLAHGYLGLDPELVWSVIEQDLPGLAQAVARMRQTLDERPTR